MPYWDLIGHQCYDQDEKKLFTIEGVCKTSNHSSYFFRYSEESASCSSDDCHHTPCDAILYEDKAVKFRGGAQRIIQQYAAMADEEVRSRTGMLSPIYTIGRSV